MLRIILFYFLLVKLILTSLSESLTEIKYLFVRSVLANRNESQTNNEKQIAISLAQLLKNKINKKESH